MTGIRCRFGIPGRHCERSEAIQGPRSTRPLDRFVAALLAMTTTESPQISKLS
jgi:hypothetical protein